MSFTLGGKTARELGIVMLRESQRPILPGTVDKTMSIPGRHGAWDFGAELDARVFELECAFVTKNRVELQQHITALAAHLVDSYGRPRKLELRFDVQPDRYWIVRYAGRLPVERVAGLGRFTLPLVAYDPFAYSDQERIHEDVITTSPHEQVVEVAGNVRTAPVIVLTNEGAETITYFRITNEYKLEG